jgi:hypothetical protein
LEGRIDASLYQGGKLIAMFEQRRYGLVEIDLAMWSHLTTQNGFMGYDAGAEIIRHYLIDWDGVTHTPTNTITIIIPEDIKFVSRSFFRGLLESAVPKGFTPIMVKDYIKLEGAGANLGIQHDMDAALDVICPHKVVTGQFPVDPLPWACLVLGLFIGGVGVLLVV